MAFGGELCDFVAMVVPRYGGHLGKFLA